MRSFLVLLTTSLTVVAADPPRRTATVDVDGAEVRSGPALRYQAVAELRKGDSILILRDEDKWFYAIEPPPGSVSWVKAIHLGKVDLAGVGKANVPVAVEGAEVFAGTDRKSGPTNHATLRLPRGTIVEVTGPSVRLETTNCRTGTSGGCRSTTSKPRRLPPWPRRRRGRIPPRPFPALHSRRRARRLPACRGL
jgi:hypothetical protein